MEPVSMVIKVKYGDMLRRFSVLIIDRKHLEITIHQLKEKICSLFNFSLASIGRIMLTYTDGDGDIVDLVDDDDLLDVVKQGLNPLRINVKLVGDRDDDVYNSTLPADFKSGFLQILKTVLDSVQPLCEKLANLSTDTTSSARDFIDYFPKIGIDFLDKLRASEITSLPKTCCDIPSSVEFVAPGYPSDLHESNQDLTLPQYNNSGALKVKSCVSELDSVLIGDVSVLDGTIVVPSIPFTKIWRMRNSGVVQWPHGTQLIWIGGDRLSHQSCVEVNIPADGLPVEKELDIAVDLISPKIPGDYISYWRLVSPSGEKFGQYIRVIVQVEEVRGLNSIVDEVITRIPSSPVAPPISAPRNMVLIKKKKDDDKVIARKPSSPAPPAPPISVFHNVILRKKNVDSDDDSDDCGVDEWDHIDKEMGLDDMFMSKVIMRKKNGINKNKTLRKKNNRWK